MKTGSGVINGRSQAIGKTITDYRHIVHQLAAKRSPADGISFTAIAFSAFIHAA